MKKNNGIFVGRLCPVHLGHEMVIRKMKEDVGENCLVIIGSSNNPISLRHFFSYEERRELLRGIFPDIKSVGIPDYSTDGEWLAHLDDILNVADFDPQNTFFYGGCEEDIRWFVEKGRKCRIVNRFDGTTPKISATEVRDALIHRRDLINLLSPTIAEKVVKTFQQKWEIFKKM